MRSHASRTCAATASSPPDSARNAGAKSITGIVRVTSATSFTAIALKMFMGPPADRTIPLIDSPRTAGPQPGDVLRLARPLIDSPRTAGPQPRDVLRLARPLIDSPRTAGPQPRDVLRLARPLIDSPRTAGPQPRDVLRLARPLIDSPR